MAETAAATGEGRRGEIASNFASSTRKRGRGSRETFARAYSKRRGNKRKNKIRARAMKKLCGFTAKLIIMYLTIQV